MKTRCLSTIFMKVLVKEVPYPDISFSQCSFLLGFCFMIGVKDYSFRKLKLCSESFAYDNNPDLEGSVILNRAADAEVRPSSLCAFNVKVVFQGTT